MKWFWYVAKDDELMMDCDSRTTLEIAMKRLEKARGFEDYTDRKELLIKEVFVSPSHSKEHFHFVIRLKRPMSVLERMVWQLYFMDHVYRSVKNLFRVVDGI